MRRRHALRTLLAAGTAPLVLPARLFGQQAPSNQVRLGVIGAGAQGTGDLRSFLGLDAVRVAGICDVNRANLDNAVKLVKEFRPDAELKTWVDYRELLDDPGIDAVLIATPIHGHFAPALLAATKGKHMYLEKPLTLSHAENLRLHDAVTKAGIRFQLGVQQRSDVRFRWACALARSGRLGKLKEIQVGVPGGMRSEVFGEQPVPAGVDWARWSAPAPVRPFHPNRLQRQYHENIADYSLGMIQCWGIHHLDIASWGNGTDGVAPARVSGEGVWPDSGTCDAILEWKVRFEYANAAPIVFADQGKVKHGVRFEGESGWIHVDRGSITAHHPDFLRDPQNKEDALPVKLPVSRHHAGNLVEAIQGKAETVAPIGIALSSDTLCQLAFIAARLKRPLAWDGTQFSGDAEADGLLTARF